MSDVCACGLNLSIWQNSWNHAQGCPMDPVIAPAAPDRPGDRDQQQAAELIDEITFGGHSWDGAQQTVANAVAAARAEEAARWQAKIEALASHWDDGSDHGRFVAQDLRAVLDDER